VETRRDEHGLLVGAFLKYLLEGGRLYCLDAGNCFDPYPLALAARSEGLAPEMLLERVFVSRAATCHQIVSVVEEMLLPLCEEPGTKGIAVLGLDTLFADEDIPLFERRYLFGRALKGIAGIRSAGVGCIVTHRPPLSGQKNHQDWPALLKRTLKPNQLMEDSNHGQNHSDLYALS
jgi:hypothetical protein